MQGHVGKRAVGSDGRVEIFARAQGHLDRGASRLLPFHVDIDLPEIQRPTPVRRKDDTVLVGPCRRHIAVSAVGQFKLRPAARRDNNE